MIDTDIGNTIPPLKKPGALFWILGIVFLLWNLIGCAGYLVEQMMSDASYVEMYGAAALPLRESYPIWASFGYGIGVWVGLVAVITLLLRKRIAAPLFVISFIGAVVSFVWGWITPEAKEVMGNQVYIMSAVVIVLGLLEIWWSRRKVADGTLN